LHISDLTMDEFIVNVLEKKRNISTVKMDLFLEEKYCYLFPYALHYPLTYKPFSHILFVFLKDGVLSIPCSKHFFSVYDLTKMDKKFSHFLNHSMDVLKRKIERLDAFASASWNDNYYSHERFSELAGYLDIEQLKHTKRIDTERFNTSNLLDEFHYITLVKDGVVVFKMSDTKSPSQFSYYELGEDIPLIEELKEEYSIHLGTLELLNKKIRLRKLFSV